jgi:chromate transporter
VAVRSFLTGASAAVIGAIAGSAIPLGLALQRWWQVPVLAGALLWVFVARRGVVSGLLIAGGVGAVLALSGVLV